jgi:ABC-type sugar transport system ATPase subunit
VLISHNLNDVFQVADSVSVLYLGRMAAQVRTKDVRSNQVVELITAGRSGSIGLTAADTPADEAAERAEPGTTTTAATAATTSPEATS